ncbi:MAG: hypothetical protein M3O70_24810 [Actinomycetota bacterium]|nr:hypothetical protein [Actinomycetota bacterium]
MTVPADLFREEALEFWTRQRGPSAVLRLSSPWLRWLYWIVLGIALAGLALAFTVRIDETISGSAQVNGQEGTFLAVLPASSSSELDGDSALRVKVDTPAGRRSVDARVLRMAPADDDDISRAGFEALSQPAILVTGAIDATDLAGFDSSPHGGRVLVVLRSERAISVLLRGFRGGDT